MILVSGERRLKAMILLHTSGRSFKHIEMPVPMGEIPFLAFESLSAEEALEVELEENIKRVDLPWQERVKAVEKLHKLKTSQNPEWTKKDTVELINPADKTVTRTVTHSIALAQHLNNPVIAKAKNEREAVKLLRKELENDFRTALAKMGPEKSSHTLIHSEVQFALADLADESFDVILTDPPYGIDAQNFDAEMILTHDYDDDWESVMLLLSNCVEEFYRVAKPKAHLYLFCAVERFYAIKELCEEAGWEVWKRPFIWVKDTGHTAKIDYGPSYNYECILFANKGAKLVTQKASDVILGIPTVKEKKHAAEKPVDLYVNLLRRSVVAGDDAVLDAFCGSGVIFAAANRLGLTATGIDGNAVSIGISQERLNSKD